MQSVKEQQYDNKSDRNNDQEIEIQPQVKFVNCPIRTSIEIVVKKCTILIIRDISVRIN
ncbi:MAG: hypothetical protein AB7F53_08125 [Nitrososphaeraceae archaeon]